MKITRLCLIFSIAWLAIATSCAAPPRPPHTRTYSHAYSHAHTPTKSHPAAIHYRKSYPFGRNRLHRYR